MNQGYKGKAKYLLTWSLTLLLAAVALYGSNAAFNVTNFGNKLTTNNIAKSGLVNRQFSRVRVCSNNKLSKDYPLLQQVVIDSPPIVVVDTLQFKSSKDSLDAPVKYHADDSMVLDNVTKKILLYGKKTSVQYQDNNLEAPHIEFNQRTNMVSAAFVKDSTGKVIAYPTFKQGDFISVSDSIKFDMKTGKGITKGTYTKEGEMFVHGDLIKKVDANTFYAYRGSFTTCNLDTPHFAFVSNKIKFVNKKMAYTGPVHPEVEGIPLPITFPFGIFPLTQGRHSGLLAPTFTVNQQWGLALDGMGFYKIINQNWDAVIRGTLYSYGGWTANISPRYYKRYHYQGSFNFDIQHFKDLDNGGSRTFNVKWSHSVDSKARPGVTFFANVNAGSTKYNSVVPNSTQLNLTNVKSSTISFTKSWKDKPFNLGITANHDQNAVTRLVDISLPNVIFNVNTLYPFRNEKNVGTYNWYENIGIGLSSALNDKTKFYDSLPIINQITNNFQWGAVHSIPISLSLPPVGPLQISPSISFSNSWYQNKLIQKWNTTNKKVDSNYTKGFYQATDMSFGFSLTSNLYGMIGFDKSSKLQAIRHKITPSLSFSYHPDFNSKNFYSVQVDTIKTIQRRSIYSNNITGVAYNEGQSGAIAFNLDNHIDIKVKDKKDTSGLKKIALLDVCNLNTSYDLLKDSFNLSPIYLRLGTTLFEKVNITVSGTTNPYQIDSTGKFINKYIWSKKPISLGKLTAGSISLSTNFKGGDKKEKLPNNKITNPYQNTSGLPIDEYQQEVALINNNAADYVNFNIPWSLSLSYSLQYTFGQNLRRNGDTSIISQNAMINSTLNLTPKWQIAASGYYNITLGQLSGVSLNISREMHCWQMTISMSPLGNNKYFNISIHPKSSILRDLKINRTRNFYEQ